LNRSVEVFKRFMDVILSLIILIVTLPVTTIIMILIKTTSKGPIFYIQKRMGQGTEFNMIKFRTMVDNAETITGVTLSWSGDPRITWIGHYLRKYRLDEIPNFINVLKGDMSIIGPRPERKKILEDLGGMLPLVNERTRYLKPGITGLAQVKLGYDGSIGGSDHELDPVICKEELCSQFSEEIPFYITTGYKLYYDFTYAAYMLRFMTAIKMDFMIMLRTPIIMFFSNSANVMRN
jgi:lipopolysaccharide/colanic/teichoic acid biosynthesis glycosyltransferase